MAIYQILTEILQSIEVYLFSNMAAMLKIF